MSDRDDLSEELRRLRDEHRIRSQAELAKLSHVSQSQIKLIEAGKTATKPSTLMLLARGLATDHAGNVDGRRAEAIYERLMSAAGLLPRGRTEDADEGSTSWADFRRRIEEKTGRHDVAMAADTLLRNYERIPRRHQRVWEEMILGLAEDIAESEKRAD